MAEVLTHWPVPQALPQAQFVYPWSQWGRLDENGHGDIWLCEQGIDFPEDMPPVRFRSIIYDRARRETRKRQKNAPQVIKRVHTASGDRVKKVADFRTLRVKVIIVSTEQVAFQFYDSDEAPPIPEVIEVAIPRRRKPLHRIANRRQLERVYA
jgi:hypothetical protein